MKKDIMMFIAIKSDCYIRVSQSFCNDFGLAIPGSSLRL